MENIIKLRKEIIKNRETRNKLYYSYNDNYDLIQETYTIENNLILKIKKYIESNINNLVKNIDKHFEIGLVYTNFHKDILKGGFWIFIDNKINSISHKYIEIK